MSLEEFYKKIRYGYRIREKRKTIQIGIESNDLYSEDLGTFIQIPIETFFKMVEEIKNEVKKRGFSTDNKRNRKRKASKSS